MNAGYQHTINWAYKQSPEEKPPRQRREWVTNYLVMLKHWDAVEEHLRFLNGFTDEELDTWSSGPA